MSNDLKEKQPQSISRRDALKSGIGLSALGSLISESVKAQSASYIKTASKNGKIIVVGAGAFGGWTALHLLRKGYKVTLIDQFGPGNNQASSGGENRLIRPFYGDKKVYFDLVLRSLEIWKENEPLFGRKILHQNGLLLFYQNAENPGVKDALPLYKNAGLTLEKISPADAAKRWPQIRTDDLDHLLFDPVSGFLEARNGCQVVLNQFVKEGGTFIQQSVTTRKIAAGKAESVTLSDGSVHQADSFVFAGGPWLVRLFPEITQKLKVTRQGYFFFAAPPGQSDLLENHLPTWMNRPSDTSLNAYGIPGNAFRGFKVAVNIQDDITDKFDTYNRYLKPEELERAKNVLISRFPKMAGRPLIEQRVCQYTETPDKDFILDKHPEASNLWILGGGSGHGYKHGASFGELASNTVSGGAQVKDVFALKRLLV